MLRYLTACLVWVCLAMTPARAQVTQPPLEAYGDLPFIRLMAISPKGTRIGFVARVQGQDVVAEYDLKTGKVTTHIGVDNVATRDIWFADETHLLLIVSEATSIYGFRGELEYSAAFSYNFDSGKIRQLLKGADGLYPAQSGLGRVVGRRASEPDRVLMPAYTGRSSSPGYDLLSADLDSSRAKVVKPGKNSTIDWFMDEEGVLLAREDYDNKTDTYQVFSEISGDFRKIYETNAPRPPFNLVGVKSDRSALIVIDDSEELDGFAAMFEMDFDGKLSAPVLGRADADIEQIFKTQNRFVLGVKYSGAYPSYHFYDAKTNKAVDEMVSGNPGYAVHIASATEDWSKILYLVYGFDTPGRYILQDTTTGELRPIAFARNDIAPEAVGEVATISYKARDGLGIQGILTWPAGSTAESRKNLPLIVMPHGGPASYDRVGFDWMAQYFANRGYLVLQPNFRGSTGYGTAFMQAGHGEWGGKMQDDVSDGVLGLVKAGMADPERVCIVGASYGGYSALAGGAFSPELYDCVVAIAPVSDLPRMIRDVTRDRGARHWAVDYWQELIGDPRAEKDKLEAISPANAADKFTAPVLLIHGKKDTVVPIEQSEIMERALKKAGKQVTFVELKSEDHWLSYGETRLETLKAMSSFVDQHIGQ